MAHGIIVNVPAPIDMYQEVYAQVTDRVGDTTPPGLLVHIARETDDGFQVIEVWESKQQREEFGNTVLGPIIDQVSKGQAPSQDDVAEEFDVENFFVGTRVAGAPTR
jgi:hypothetical protein